jgi:hypothetical protein
MATSVSPNLRSGRLPAGKRLLAVSLVFLGVLCGAPAQGQDPATEEATAGPTAEEISLRLEERLQQLTKVRDLLAAFLKGEKLTDVLPEALFILDLADEDAVKQRVEDLKILQRHPERGYAEEAALAAKAAASDPSLTTKVNEIAALDGEINRLRLKFLSLPRKQREALLRAQKIALEQSALSDTLARERASGQTRRVEAAAALDTAQQLVEASPRSDIRDLALQHMLVQNAQMTLADLRVRWSAGYEERNRFYREIAEKLSALAAALATLEPQEPVSDHYIEATRIWRALVSRTFAQIGEFARVRRIPALPAYPESLLNRLEGTPEASSYRKAYQDLTQDRESLARLRIQYMNALRESLYRLLLQSADLRSAFLREAVRKEDYPILRQPAEYFADLLRELRIVPYMWMAGVSMALFTLNESLALGVKGVLDLTKQGLLFIAVIAVPFLVYPLARPLRGMLARSQDMLMSVRSQLPLAGSLAVQLQWVRPYVPWIVALFGVWVAGRLAVKANLKMILRAVPYANYYIGYRMFRMVLASTFTRGATSGEAQARSIERERVHRTARRLGIFFFFAMAFLRAVQDAVGKALAYRVILFSMILLGILISALTAWQWRNRIAQRAEQLLPAILGTRIKALCSGRLSVFWCLPALVLLLPAFIVDRLAAFSIRFDVFKRLQAEFFRRRLESGGGEIQEKTQLHPIDGQLPEDYLRWFDTQLHPDESLWIHRKSPFLKTLPLRVRTWAEGKTDEHSVALYGEKGIGKSELLGRLAREFADLRVLSLSLPPKLLSREGVLRFLGESLGMDLTHGGRDLVRGDAGQPRTVIFIDDAHNLFLAELGGFVGFRAFQELISARTRNFFWCAAFNRRSWLYLLGALGQDLSFRHSFALPRWSDEEIRDLIMRRHNRTAYRLSYESIIRATAGQGDDAKPVAIEVQFYRLMWDQAQGNPRTAMSLWVSSLSPLGGYELRVRPPKAFQAKDLETASDDLMFVYASITCHENLSTDEAIAATNLPEATVRQAIAIGIEKSILFAGKDQRYRITTHAQPFLTRILVRRNFLYE